MKAYVKLSLLPLLLILSLGCNSNTSTDDDNELEGLLWSEEFNGNDWDQSVWYPELGASGWGNNELQEYTPFDRNLEVSDGTLKIHALLEGAGQNRGDYTSARLLTYQTFTYGRIEIRAKMPRHRGNGLWPAIWMLGDSIRNGTSWPLCGEIDIMEYVSYDPGKTHASIHTAANNHRQGNAISSGGVSLPSMEEEFHIYGLLWQEDGLIFYIDEPTNVILNVPKPENPTAENWPFDQPHFFLLNMAVGGDWGGAQGVDDSIFPATFEIDYVRVFEL